MPPKPKMHVNNRNHSYKNIANFKRCIKSIICNNVYYINNMILQFDFFMNNIINIFNKCFPIESTKINYKNRNPWINQNLKNDIKIRDKVLLLSRQIPTQENKDNYKKYKNIMRLFDILIRPILTFDCKIWGVGSYDEVTRSETQHNNAVC